MSIRRFVIAVTIATVALPLSVPAAPIEEVVVTAQRQAYRGNVATADTPQTITVLDAQLIERAGLTSLAETLDLSASMARQNNGGNRH